MKQMLQRGFTLIELLVVIAIIGILAAVVIGSLNDARSGGQNASIQQTMANFRSIAEVYYNDPNGGSYAYSNLCSDSRATSSINAALNVVNVPANQFSDIEAENDPASTASGDRRGQCVANASAYQVTVPMAGGDWDQYWCVDSTGQAVQLAEADKPAGAATTCN